ncbi:MAG TPA: hypothetical protein VGJ83_00510 [Gemmatimonadales bacterium]|jgi:hypothetical protein
MKTLIIQTMGLLSIAAATATLGAQAAPTGRDVERRCQSAAWPKKLPTPGAVMDTVALGAAFGILSAADSTSVLFSIMYPENGPAAVRWLEPDSAPKVLHDSLLAVVTRGLLPLAAPKPLGAIRLRLQGGRANTATLERAVYCPPQPTVGDDGEPVRALARLSPSDRAPPAGRQLRLEAETSLDEGGHVINVRLISGSGIREVDDALVNDLWHRLYLPALIDGTPIPSWLRTGGTRMRL